MLNIVIIGLAIVLLAGLLYFEKANQFKGKVLTKTVVSCLFILAALIQQNSIPGYHVLILIGLIFCLGGDVCLSLPQERMFLLGLVSFLVGHVFYVFGFFYAADLSSWTWTGIVVSLITSCVVFVWLRPYLESMLIPVVCYICVITFMVVGAWTVVGDSLLDVRGRFLVFIGAQSFYFSDVFVARDRFLKMEFINRLFGLPMYYLGQFLLAFSIGCLKPAAM
jgi:uncharacterized membrane protein YhhN